MKKLKSYIGKKYGKLTVLKELDPSPYSYKGWKINRRNFLCKCDCGKEINLSINSLVAGNTKSCGCLVMTRDLTFKLDSEYAKNFIREEIKVSKDGRNRRGFIYLCKDCSKEIFLYPDFIKNSSFLCRKCSMSKNQKSRYSVFEGLKECKYCDRYLDVEEFARINNGQRLQVYCKRCSYLQNYGISAVDYDKLFSQQNGLCKICKNPEADVYPSTGKIKSLSVDHCHTTGQVRGLLCSKCNKGLGIFKDSIEFLQ